PRKERHVHILWARHGQNTANLSHTLSYRVFDGDLTGQGRQQAEMLADQLSADRGDPVGYLACSPLRRARQTAEIIGARLRLPVTVCGDDLRELNVGDLDGRSDAAAWGCTRRCSRPGRRAMPGPASPAARTGTRCAPGSGAR